METRERILEAAARLYGQHGYLGATNGAYDREKVLVMAVDGPPRVLRIEEILHGTVVARVDLIGSDSKRLGAPADPLDAADYFGS